MAPPFACPRTRCSYSGNVTKLLIGLDVDELSVGIPNIPGLKAQIRDMAYEDARDLARRALMCDAAAEVRALTSELA